MRGKTSIIAVAGFATLCGMMAMILLYISPTPMPPANSQLFGVLIGLFSAAGFTLLAIFSGGIVASSKDHGEAPKIEG